MLSSPRLGSVFIIFLSEFFFPCDFFLVALHAVIPLHMIFSLPQSLIFIGWESLLAIGQEKCFTVLSISYYIKSIRLVI